MERRICRLTAILAAMLALAQAPAVAGPPDDVTTANRERAAQATGALDIGWRQPKVRLPGSSRRIPLPQAAGLQSSGLAEAVEYSRSQGGLALLVWHKGRLILEDYAAGAGPESASATYSMHKSVLALTILAAIEDGFIESLETPVGQYLEEWADDPRGGITFRELLQHTSGLTSYSFGEGDPKAVALVYSDRIRETALSAEADIEPGSRFDYSNFNSQIAGLALEAALSEQGLSYASYLGRRIWEPLGAADAALWADRNGGTVRYFSGLEARPRDWLRLGILILEEGRFDGERVLSEASIRQLLKPSAANPNYGLHIWRGTPWQRQRSYGPGTPLLAHHSAPYLADDVVFFDGFGGQRVYIVPSQDLVIVRTGNPDMSWDDARLPNLVLRALAKIGKAPDTPGMSAEDAELLYRERLAALLAARSGSAGLPGYDPLEAVPGSSPDPLPSWDKGAPPIGEETLARMRDWAEASNATSLLIWYKGRLLEESYFGETERDTLINSRSMAKPLSVIAVGRAIAEGHIRSLDQPVADYLEEWRGTPKAGITLRHLLQMRSGLAPQGFSSDADDIMNRAYLHPFHAQIIIDEYPLAHPPGSRYDYSNANSELIAPIIERATGLRYSEWISSHVLKPLDAAGGRVWVNRRGGTAHSGCCILLPARTWLRISVLLLQDGAWQGRRLLPQGFVEAMRTPTPENRHAGMGIYVAGSYIRYRGHANPEIDYGKSLHTEPYLAADLFLFDGNGSQVSYIIPSHDLVILRTGTNPPENFVWDNSWLPNTFLRALSAAKGIPLTPQPAGG